LCANAPGVGFQDYLIIGMRPFRRLMRGHHLSRVPPTIIPRNTGKREWNFPTTQKEGEAGYETWDPTNGLPIGGAE